MSTLNDRRTLLRKRLALFDVQLYDQELCRVAAAAQLRAFDALPDDLSPTDDERKAAEEQLRQARLNIASLRAAREDLGELEEPS